MEQKRSSHVIITFAIAIGMYLYCTSMAFAAIDLANIENLLSDIYVAVFGITTALALVIIVISLLAAMITTNQRTTAACIGWTKKVVIIWIIINMLGFGIKIIQEATAGGSADITQYL